ncbi:hypothetical protein V490_00386 [Pseudogymnoascus sp. VKM F-3557]|nr:hypothetical protein V490_00386 [Pseudogymnoascus sp. VKM F-3557]
MAIYIPIDTDRVCEDFSQFPAAISAAASEVEDAVKKVIQEATEDGTRERRRADIRHSNKCGDPYSICHSPALPQRLILVATITEALWIHDDVTEELDHTSACKEHDGLAQMLRLDIEPSSKRQKAFQDVIKRAVDMDPAMATSLTTVIRQYLKTSDLENVDFRLMKDYIPYRINHSGYWMSSYFIRWGMGLTLTTEEYDSVRNFDVAMGNILGLTNDYFSWFVEEHQNTDRVRNGVRVLMNEHNVDADIARDLLLGIIVKEEVKAKRLKEERLKNNASDEILQYFQAIELHIGGSCYWHATAPRYQKFE